MNYEYCRLAVAGLLAGLLLAGMVLESGDMDKNTDKQETPQHATVDGTQSPRLKPGKWEALFELGENLFPSMVICTATLKDDGENDEFRIGNPWSSIGVAICPPQTDCPVKVEISGGSYIKSGVWKGILPKRGEVYRIFPTLKYD